MKKIAFILMMTTILSKLLGFIRDMVLSYFYGISYITDAYLISQTIPSVIFDFISIAISTGFIPVYAKILKDEGNKAANDFINNLLNILFFVCTILCIVGFLFTEKIVFIFASGFKGEVLDLSVKFTKISLMIMFFSAIISIFSAFLQVNDNYIIPSLKGLPLNIVTIIFIYLSTKGNILLLSIGSILSALVVTLFLLYFVKKKNYNYKFCLDYKNKSIRLLYKLAIPAIIGISVNQINFLIDRTIASNIVEGGISILNYSNRINNIVQGLFVAPIFTVLYPNISKMAVNSNFTNFKKSISRSMGTIAILIMPITIGTMIFSTQIVDILFGRGKFDESAILMTSSTLFFYSIGMIGFAWREIISRGFYSMQDTKTPTINASFAMFVNIILNVTLSRFMGINGLALATSISATLSTFLLLINFRKKIGSIDGKRLLIICIKILFASIIMGVVSKNIYSILILNINKFFGFILSVLIGITVYCIILIFMNIDEVEYIKIKFKEKFYNSAI